MKTKHSQLEGEGGAHTLNTADTQSYPEDLVQTKCKGETWEEAEKRNKHFENIGYNRAREEFEKKIDDWALRSVLTFDDDSIKQKRIIDDITKYVKELKEELKK
jgi:hypothetical protein